MFLVLVFFRSDILNGFSLGLHGVKIEVASLSHHRDITDLSATGITLHSLPVGNSQRKEGVVGGLWLV